MKKSISWLTFICFLLVAANHVLADPQTNNQLRSASFQGTVTNKATGETYQIVGGGIGTTKEGKCALMYILGLPFSPPTTLAVEGELLNNQITIKIVDYDKTKKLLIPTKDSPIPQAEPTGNQTGKSFTHAANVTWVFTKPGITFETQDAVYTSKRSGAKISFTNREPLLDGVEKSSKK